MVSTFERFLAPTMLVVHQGCKLQAARGPGNPGHQSTGNQGVPKGYPSEGRRVCGTCKGPQKEWPAANIHIANHAGAHSHANHNQQSNTVP